MTPFAWLGHKTSANKQTWRLQILYFFQKVHFRFFFQLFLGEQQIFWLQMLLQNHLHAAGWYASTAGYSFYQQLGIPFLVSLYNSDICLGNRSFSSIKAGVIFDRQYLILKTLTHQNTMCSSIYITQFIKYLLYIYIKSQAEFYIDMSFSIFIHVIKLFTNSIYDCVYFKLKYLGHLMISLHKINSYH